VIGNVEKPERRIYAWNRLEKVGATVNWISISDNTLQKFKRLSHQGSLFIFTLYHSDLTFRFAELRRSSAIAEPRRFAPRAPCLTAHITCFFRKCINSENL
jgi:hypothetical protein